MSTQKQKPNPMVGQISVLMRHNLTRQYHSLYNARYKKLRQRFKPSVQRLDQMPKETGATFSVVATLFVAFAKRDTLIPRFKDSGVIKWQVPLEHDDADTYFLEDKSDHIAIQAPDKWALDKARLPYVITGMVACFTLQQSDEQGPDGVYRYAVRKVIWPGDRPAPIVSPRAPLPTPKRSQLLVLADVRPDAKDRSPLALLTQKPLAENVMAIVLIGPFAHTLKPPEDNEVEDVVQNGSILTFAERNADYKLKQMQTHHAHLERLRQQRPVFLIPSSSDLTSYRLPQRAMDMRLFGFAPQTPRLRMLTNPYVLTLAKRRCYLVSDMPVRAVQHVSPALRNAPANMLRAIHVWHHVAPCVPDFYACEPQRKKDPLRLPNGLDWIVMSMAQDPSFSGLIVKNTIGMPSFHHTKRMLSIQIQTKLCQFKTL